MDLAVAPPGPAVFAPYPPPPPIVLTVVQEAMPPPPPPPVVTDLTLDDESISGSVARTPPDSASVVQGFLQQMLALSGAPAAAARDMSESKRWSSSALFEQNKNTLLWAMKPEHERSPPTEPNASMKAFIAVPEKQAVPVLRRHLSDRGLDMNIEYQFVYAIRNLHFRALNEPDELPIGFSVFCCGQKKVNGERQPTFFELDFQERNRQVEPGTLQRLTKSGAQVPDTADLLANQLRNYQAVVEFVFTNESPLFLALRPWVRWSERNRLSIRLMIDNDEYSLGKVLFHIDNRVQEFLRTCEQATASSDVQYRLLDFQDIFNEISNMKDIQYYLPRCLRALINPTAATSSASAFSASQAKRHATVSDSDTTTKRPRNGGSSTGTGSTASTTKPAVNNPDVDQQLRAKANANYQVYKARFSTIPKANGTVICAQYHLLGSCKSGATCPRAATHRRLSQPEKSLFAGWCAATSTQISAPN